MITLGMGCDRDTPLETLERAVELALATKGLERNEVLAMASIDKKSDEVALLELARGHRWPLLFYTAQELAKVEVPNPSDVVMKYMGTPAVSEAAALLAAGPGAGIGDLLVEKFKHKGADGKNATVSIARVKND